MQFLKSISRQLSGHPFAVLAALFILPVVLKLAYDSQVVTVIIHYKVRKFKI